MKEIAPYARPPILLVIFHRPFYSKPNLCKKFKFSQITPFLRHRCQKIPKSFPSFSTNPIFDFFIVKSEWILKWAAAGGWCALNLVVPRTSCSVMPSLLKFFLRVCRLTGSTWSLSKYRHNLCPLDDPERKTWKVLARVGQVAFPTEEWVYVTADWMG